MSKYFSLGNIDLSYRFRKKILFFLSEIKEQIKEISKNLDRRGSIDDVLIKTDAGRQGIKLYFFNL